MKHKKHLLIVLLFYAIVAAIMGLLLMLDMLHGNNIP